MRLRSAQEATSLRWTAMDAMGELSSLPCHQTMPPIMTIPMTTTSKRLLRFVAGLHTHSARIQYFIGPATERAQSALCIRYDGQHAMPQILLLYQVYQARVRHAPSS